MHVDTTFGARLHDVMVSNGLTVVTLAKRRGVPVSVARAWLRMATARLPGEQLAWIGMDFRVSILWLALGLGSPEPLGNQRAAQLTEVQ